MHLEFQYVASGLALEVDVVGKLLGLADGLATYAVIAF